MDVRELVSMGYVPKPKETLEEYLKSGEEWYNATEKFKQALEEDLKGTLKEIRIYVPKDSSAQLETKLYSGLLKDIVVSEPNFLVIEIPREEKKKTKLGRLRLAQLKKLKGCAYLIKYNGVKFPIAIDVREGNNSRTMDDKLTEVHEISHCIRRRWHSILTKDAIFNEKISYLVGGMNYEFYSRFLKTRLKKEKKEKRSDKRWTIFDAAIGALCLPFHPPLALLLFGFSGINAFGFLTKKYRNIEEYCENMTKEMYDTQKSVGGRNLLKLLHRTTRKEFLQIHQNMKDGKSIGQIMDFQIQNSCEDYKWRWEFIKEELNKKHTGNDFLIKAIKEDVEAPAALENIDSRSLLLNNLEYKRNHSKQSFQKF